MSRLTLAGFAALVAVAGVTLGAAPHAFAQPVQTQRDLAAPARQAVSQVLYASTSTSAAGERALDARLNEQRRAIEALRGRITQAGGRNEALAAELSTAQERYCAALAERDRAYAQEIAVLRGAAEDIASTSEGLAALERFNAGDELGALVALDRLRDAREGARQVRNNIESAAEGRDIATLALEARNRGRLDTAAVITRYEEVTQLDPGVHGDWIRLSRLYVDAGNLSEAWRATEQAAQTAGDDRDRSFALSELGNVLVARGDFAGARARFEEALVIRQRLAAADPSSMVAQRDVSVSLIRIGDMLARWGDHNRGRARLTLLGVMGELLGDQPDLPGARAYYEESLAILQRLAAADPSSARLQRDVGAGAERVGDVLFAQGDLAGARARYEQSLAIAQRLAAADPSSVSLQRDVRVGLVEIGDVLIAQGDLAGGRARFEESLRISQILAAADPSSAEAQRDVWMSMWRLQRFPESGITWAQIVAAMEAMQARGVLLPTDRNNLEQARARAALERR